MSTGSPATGGDALQFDAAEMAGATAAGGAPGTPVCAQCARPVPGEYYAAGDVVVCPGCRAGIEATLAERGGAGGLARAALFGAGGALAGAALYVAVVLLANVEIGIIAIAVGWLVGRAMQLGSGDRRGRRYQLLGVALTWLGIGVAYTVAAYRADVLAQDPLTLAISVVLLPALANFTQGVGGILGLIIIGVGLLQAWQMNRPLHVAFTGPHRVGAPRA